MNAVDTHVHIFTRELRPVPGARYVPDYDALLADLFALQDAAGITHTVLVQPSFLGTDNDCLLAALGAYPGRLRAVVVVDATLPASLVDDWDRRGVRGVRLNLYRMENVPDFSAPEWKALFSSVAARGWHVEVHAVARQLAHAVATLEGCPASLVFDHFALPDSAHGTASPEIRALLGMAEHQAVFVKLSAPYRLEGGNAVQYAKFWLEHIGPDRLMWGSDWPWTNHEGATTYAACAQELARWVADPEDRRRILWDTPKRLFRF